MAPPIPVQQLQQALADRDPQVAIELPADGATLPADRWRLRLKVWDWPLVDAGSLGLGPHVAVQIDDQPVLRLTEHHRTPGGAVVETSLPALPPGSHRITAYAARPWGEALKNPGASSRIQVQSIAANVLAVPAPGTPELVAVSPAEWSSAEPVLLDWLLFDAPLQHLREGDGSWRLRVRVNGDAFLVDQNVPMWLRGWNNGSNALQLDLVDGRGDPLNPPFNSLVRAVNLGGENPPRWLGGPLRPEELAALLGDAPPPQEQAAAPEEAAEPDVELGEGAGIPSGVDQAQSDQDAMATAEAAAEREPGPAPDSEPGHGDPSEEDPSEIDSANDSGLGGEDGGAGEPEPEADPEPEPADRAGGGMAGQPPASTPITSPEGVDPSPSAGLPRSLGTP